MSLEVKIKDKSECLEKKLLIIRKMMYYKEPISMYKVAKDLGMSTSGLYYHFTQLIDEKIIDSLNGKYIINSSLKYINIHAELLFPFIESVMKANPDLKPDELLNLISYMLAMLSIEVDGNEDKG